MSVRDTRLWEEYKLMKRFNSEVVRWEAITSSGKAPDRYILNYNLRSIVDFDDNNQPVFQEGFKVEVKFPSTYPRGKPIARFIDQRILHPNVWPDGRLCIEDRWIPGQGISLDKICQIIGKIISYQDYNVKAPANNNETLIQWIEYNGNQLPTDQSNIRGPDKPLIEFGAETDDHIQDTSNRISFG